MSACESNGRAAIEKPQYHKDKNKSHMSSHLTETTTINILRYFLLAITDKRVNPSADHMKLYMHFFCVLLFYLILHHSFNIQLMLIDHYESEIYLSLNTVNIFW